MDTKTCAQIGSDPNMFFAAAQSGSGAGTCNATGTNDLFGCGTYGIGINGCGPLTVNSGDTCSTIRTAGGWNCPDTLAELTTVTKTKPLLGGGVLCCRD
jgi:hypothetical protein